MNCSGNILSLIVINKFDLRLKISFRTLISQLLVLDMITIVFNILLFTIHFHSEFYRLQVQTGITGQDTCDVFPLDSAGDAAGAAGPD